MPRNFPGLTMTPVRAPSLDDIVSGFEHCKNFILRKVSFKKGNLEENFIGSKISNVSNGYGCLNVQKLKKMVVRLLCFKILFFLSLKKVIIWFEGKFSAFD